MYLDPLNSKRVALPSDEKHADGVAESVALIQADEAEGILSDRAIDQWCDEQQFCVSKAAKSDTLLPGFHATDDRNIGLESQRRKAIECIGNT